MPAHSAWRRIAAVALCASGAASCATGPAHPGTASLHRFREMAMGVEVLVVIDHDSEAHARRSAREALDAVRAVDEAISDWTASSGLRATLAAAEAAAPGAPVAASPALVDAVARSLEMSRITDGAFDCTAAPVIAIWREARASGTPPAESALADALQRTGYGHLSADRAGGTIRIGRRGMSLDFGGIGKGIAAAAAVEAARRSGCERVLVAVSGDVAAGAAPRGREGWQVAIESGMGSLAPCAVWLRESALSTSGDAEQVLVRGGTRHSHIVDPRTGRAVTHSIAPTVWSTDPAVADAAATALSVMGIAAMDPLCERIRATGVAIEMRVAYRDTPDGPVRIRATPGFLRCIGSEDAGARPAAAQGAARSGATGGS